MLALSCPLIAAENPLPTEESCRRFVQTFYDWYLPKAQDLDGDPLDLALKEKPSPFSAAIVRGLNRVAAESKAENDAGLDFDPILNTQDPGDPGDSYVVAKTTYKDDVCMVELYGVFSGKKTDQPLVAPELKFKSGRWIFVNFHYPNSTDKRNENLLILIGNYLAPPRRN